MRFSEKSVWRTASGIFLILFVVMGVAVHFLNYDQVDDHNLTRRYLPMSWAHPLGTDGYGRNVLFLLLKGIEAFFFPGVLAAAIAGIGGAVLGGVCGYMEGAFKQGLLWLLKLVDALPRLVMLILLCSLVQPSMMIIAAAVGLLFVPSVARTIQYRVEALAAEDYILAYRAHGFSPVMIVGYHIVWMLCRSVVIRQSAYVFGYVLFVETALSYLEFGVLQGVEDILSWGTMVAQAKNESGSWSPAPGEPHVLGLYWLAPAVAIVVTTAGVLGVGNGIAELGDRE